MKNRKYGNTMLQNRLVCFKHANAKLSGARRLWLFFAFAGIIIFIGCSEKKITPRRTPAEVFFSAGQKYASEGNFIKASEQFKKASELGGKPVYFYNLGVAYQRLTLYADAANAYKQAIDANPDYSEAWYNMALCFDKLGRIDDAKSAYVQYEKTFRKNTQSTNASTPN